jgi:methylated-DNA-[protein]-cysteine S-methyltransferase
MTHYHKIITSPVGKLTLVASEKGLAGVYFDNSTQKPASRPMPDHVVLIKTEKQLADYFAGKRTEFDLPLDMQGTDFQKKAWRALTKIPYGETVSYREQAKMLGDVKKARPIGQANGKNPISIIVPCHRVVGASGKLTGYGGGLPRKEFLLALERKTLFRKKTA